MFTQNRRKKVAPIPVIVAGSLIILYDWQWIDPLVTLMIAGYILWMSFGEIGGVVRILMLGSPPELRAGLVIAAIDAVDGVTGHASLRQVALPVRRSRACSPESPAR